MVAKMTIRLPERVAAQLRERSNANGLSLNETTVRAIERGLGQGDAPDEEWWRGLGDLVERPPLKKYDPDEFDRLRRGLSPGPGSILDDLDWIRGDATDL
jgi:hypothetical protein